MAMTTTTGTRIGTGTGRVAVVTGASRGIGRGITIELGNAGYTVYCLGWSMRTTNSNTNTNIYQRPVADQLELTVESVAEEVTKCGGMGIDIPCDLSQDDVIEDIFEFQMGGSQQLDVLVCSAYTTPPTGICGEVWNQGLEMWDCVNGVGLRQVYATCRVAAPLMIQTAATNSKTNSNRKHPPPLICLVSSFGGKSYTFNVTYGVGKNAIDRLLVDMSYQLAKYGVATTTLYSGLVQTKANLQMVVDGIWDAQLGGLDLAQGETPSFSGKGVVKLTELSHDKMMARSGNVEVVTELAKEFQFTDQNGQRPPSICSLQYLLPNFVFPTIEKQNVGTPIPEWIKNNIPNYLLPWSIFSSGPPPELDDQ